MARALKIYSGRNRPDLTPVYTLFERLTGIETTVEKVYHHDAERRVMDERADPQADLLLTNSQLAVEVARKSGMFEPYEAAALDGAGPVQRFRYITLPALAPALFAVACLITIYTMRAFDLILAMTGDKLLRFKPQNLVTGLPVRRLETVT